MTISFASGDPLLTTSQVLAFGYNAHGRTETDPLAMRLLQRYPTAFAACTRLGRSGQLKPGMFWTWRESRPLLLFMIVRETAVGATRLRYVQQVLLRLTQEYRLYGFQEVLLVPPGHRLEQQEQLPLIQYWLSGIPLPVTILEHYEPGKPPQPEG